MIKIICVSLLLASLIGSAQVRPFLSPTERVYVEAGGYIPLDGLKDKIQPSVNFGFWYRAVHFERESLEIGFNLTVPESVGNFEYIHRDSIFNNRIRGLGGTIGIRYSARMDFFESPTTGIEWYSTLGYGFLTYRSQFVGYADSSIPVEKERYSKVFSTTSIGLGVRGFYKNVGIQAGYQWTPYSWFYKELPRDFGSGALLVGIVYKQ